MNGKLFETDEPEPSLKTKFIRYARATELWDGSLLIDFESFADDIASVRNGDFFEREQDIVVRVTVEAEEVQ